MEPILTDIKYLKRKRLQKPAGNDINQPFGVLLEYYDSDFLKRDSLNGICLHLANNTDKRIEGYLILTTNPTWKIEPENELMIAIRPGMTVHAEFYLSVPDEFGLKPHVLHLEVKTESGIYMEAEFNLDEHMEDLCLIPSE
ncbi:MAG: hypothetical protein Q7J78_02615 [Clostridiales bacterium]|nr:hypothetical protein [Clostridiales bacterium]